MHMAAPRIAEKNAEPVFELQLGQQTGSSAALPMAERMISGLLAAGCMVPVSQWTSSLNEETISVNLSMNLPEREWNICMFSSLS